jgi:hypothetical protein
MAFITGAKCRIFNSPQEVADFIVTAVTTVLSVVVDNSGKYVLFYV